MHQRNLRHFEAIKNLIQTKHLVKLLWNDGNWKTKQTKLKTQTNYVTKLNNQCKKDHFNRLNPEKDSKPFWKSCKPYFSNKYFFGESKIASSENGEFLTENNKFAKTFNSFFETVTDWLNLFSWTSKANACDDKVQGIILFNFSNHPGNHLAFVIKAIWKNHVWSALRVHRTLSQPTTVWIL